MREITSHRVNPANDKIQILVTDEAGAGGANHRYELTGFDTEKNPSAYDPQGYHSRFSKQVIVFQNGPIAEAGVNGITQEVLIAICIDRLECFQKGSYACADNRDALSLLRAAQSALQRRTRDRMAKGIEGTHIVDRDPTVLERLKKVIRQQSGATHEQITNEASFIEDLGFDSLDLVEFIFAVEEEFDITILDEEAEQIVTVNDAVELIAGKLNRKA
jgi:acyl carrier protein